MLDDKVKNSEIIGSDRVEGTAVFGVKGEKIGSVEKLLIEKRGGQVTDAILSVGGFLGMGADHHSIPWEKLKYDTELDGYRLDVTEDELRDAPTIGESEADLAYDREYQTRVYSYYGVIPYW